MFEEQLLGSSTNEQKESHSIKTSSMPTTLSNTDFLSTIKFDFENIWKFSFL